MSNAILTTDITNETLINKLNVFLKTNDFKASDEENLFKKTILTDTQEMIFNIKLSPQKANIISCTIPIKKNLSKQDKTDIIVFLNQLAGKHKYFAFNFAERSDRTYNIYIRLTYIPTDNPNDIILPYNVFREEITNKIYPKIIKFLAEV